MRNFQAGKRTKSIRIKSFAFIDKEKTKINLQVKTLKQKLGINTKYCISI